MAVPTSGELSLLKIWSEKNESDYSANNTDGENSFSLRGVSVNSIGDSSNGNINLNTTYNPPGNRPDQSTPHKMSEFYGYDHDLNDGTYSFAGRVISGHYYYIQYGSMLNTSVRRSGYHGSRYDFGSSSYSDGSMPGGLTDNSGNTPYNSLIPHDGYSSGYGTRGKFGHGFTNSRAVSIDRIMNSVESNTDKHRIYISFHGYSENTSHGQGGTFYGRRPAWDHFYVRWHNTNTWVDLGASSTWDTSNFPTYGTSTYIGDNSVQHRHTDPFYSKVIYSGTYANAVQDMATKCGDPNSDGYGLDGAGYDVRITGIRQHVDFWVGPVFTLNAISNVSTSGFTSGRTISALEEGRQLEGYTWVNSGFSTNPKGASFNGETLTGGTGREFDLMASSSGLLTSTGSQTYTASPAGTVSLIANNTYYVCYTMAITNHPQYNESNGGSTSANNKYIFSTNTRSFTVPASNDFSATVTTGTANFYTTVFSGYITSPVTAGSISNTSFNGATITGIYFQNSSTDYIYIYFSSTKPSFSAISINGQSLGASSTWTSASSVAWRKTYSNNLFGSTGSSISITAQY